MTDVQPRANAFRQTPDVCPSHDLSLRLRNAPKTNSSPGAQASALVSWGIPGHNTYVFCTLPDQSIGEANHAAFENAPARPVPALLIENKSSLVQGPVAGDIRIPSLTGCIPNDPANPCVCTGAWWFPWCPRSPEHVRLAILYSSWFTRPPCYCGWTLSMPQLQRSCPKVASHFLDWVSRNHPMATWGVG